jgi:hypothetical protein
VIAGAGYYVARNAFAFFALADFADNRYPGWRIVWTIIGIVSIVGIVPIAFVFFIARDRPGLLDLIIALVGTFGLRHLMA